MHNIISLMNEVLAPDVVLLLLISSSSELLPVVDVLTDGLTLTLTGSGSSTGWGSQRRWRFLTRSATESSSSSISDSEPCAEKGASSISWLMAVTKADSMGVETIALWANHLKGWCIFWNWPLSGLQDVEVCAGLLQSVSRGAAECVQGYRVCAGCSFNILPCSSRLNQKIFYCEKKYFI